MEQSKNLESCFNSSTEGYFKFFCASIIERNAVGEVLSLLLKTFEKYRGSLNPHKKAISCTLIKPWFISEQAF